MSDMHARFSDPADRRAVRSLLGLAGAKSRSGVAGSSTVSRGTKADGKLRTLLKQKIAETDHLQGLLCSLELPVLYLSADLRLRRFSQAAAKLFGLEAVDIGSRLDRRWPKAPMQAMVNACRTGAPCSRVARGMDGKEWQLQMLPHAAHSGAGSGVMVILLARQETDPVDQPAPCEKTDLTPRQRQVMDRVLAGHPSKNIAADLKISQRTVENHRAAIMQRTGATSLPALARLAIGADVGGDRKAITTEHLLIAALR